MEAKEQVVYARALSGKEEDRDKDERADKVGVPREVKRTTLDNLQALLNNNRVYGCDHRASYTERDADQGYVGTIEEDADEETEGDHRAREEDHH